MHDLIVKKLSLVNANNINPFGHQQNGLALSQQELAARIGLSREMVNRMLAQLRSGGYIEQDERGLIKVLQPLPREF